MNKTQIALAVTSGIIVAGAGIGIGIALHPVSRTTTVTHHVAVPGPTKTIHVKPKAKPAPQPTTTVTQPVVIPVTQQAAPSAPLVTDPWAVVSAYYGDIDDQQYYAAYQLLSSGAVTGQSFADFEAGFACTGSETVTENWESGDQVNFSLEAINGCNGTTQYYTGTDTVQGGLIVAADVTED